MTLSHRLKYLLKHPIFEGIMGVSLIICGIFEWVYEAKKSNIDGPEGFFAILFLGIFTVSKSISLSLGGLEKISHVLGENPHPLLVLLKKMISGKFPQLFLSIVLIISGVGELFESLEGSEIVKENSEIWYIGMILLGAFNFCIFFLKFLEKIFHILFGLKRWNSNSDTKITFLKNRIKFLENPKTELIISISIIVLTGIDIFFLGFDDDYGSKAGMTIHSFYNIAMFFNKTSISAELIEDIVELEEEVLSKSEHNSGENTTSDT